MQTQRLTDAQTHRRTGASTQVHHTTGRWKCLHLNVHRLPYHANRILLFKQKFIFIFVSTFCVKFRAFIPMAYLTFANGLYCFVSVSFEFHIICSIDCFSLQNNSRFGTNFCCFDMCTFHHYFVNSNGMGNSTSGRSNFTKDSCEGFGWFCFLDVSRLIPHRDFACAEGFRILCKNGISGSRWPVAASL